MSKPRLLLKADEELIAHIYSGSGPPGTQPMGAWNPPNTYLLGA